MICDEETDVPSSVLLHSEKPPPLPLKHPGIRALKGKALSAAPRLSTGLCCLGRCSGLRIRLYGLRVEGVGFSYRV